MERVIAFLKEHPVPAVLGSIVLFILIYSSLSKGGSSSAPASVSYVPVNTGPSDAVQEAAIAASSQQYQVNAAAQASANQINGQVQLGTLQSELGAITALTSAKSTDLQTSTAGDVAMQQLTTQSNIADTAANDQVAIGALAASTQTAINLQNQQTQQLQISTAGNIATQQLNGNITEQQAYLNAENSQFAGNVGLQESLAGTAASVLNNQTGATLAVQLANIGNATNTTNLNAALASQGLDVEQTLGSMSIAGDVQNNSQVNNNVNTQILSQAGYLQNLVNLTGLGKNISGLPGVGQTTQNVSAANPNNTTSSIIASIAKLAGGIGQGISSGLGG